MTTLVAIVEPETAGDPMSDRRWVPQQPAVSRRLAEAGHQASPPTVRRLLHDLGLGLHANAKQVEGRATHPDRDTQFSTSHARRRRSRQPGLPQVSGQQEEGTGRQLQECGARLEPGGRRRERP
ncbi:MAG: hypothetical protein U0531_09110 [Dehalococcoidia bacterium]